MVEMLSRCRLIYPGLEITVPCTLNTQDNKVQLTRAFAYVCQLHQVRRHHRLAQRPRQHYQDVLTDEADRRRRKLL